MRPADDANWPVCGCDAYRTSDGWCDHVREYLFKGDDAESITSGLYYCIPIDAAFDVWAEVSIDKPIEGTDISPMAIVVESFFGDESTLIDIGYWSPGEGRFSIASVIAEWVKTANKECKQSAHSPFATYIESKKNTWLLATREMCQICYDRMKAKISGDNFGMAGVTNTAPKGKANITSTFNSAAQKNINKQMTNVMATLQQRYRS